MPAYIKLSVLALCLWVATVSGRPQQSPQLPQYILLVPQQAQQSASSEGLNPPSPQARDFWDQSQFQDASKIAQEFPAQAQQFFAQAQKALSPSPQDFSRVNQQSQAPITGLNEVPAQGQQYVAQAQKALPPRISRQSQAQAQPFGQNTYQTQPASFNTQAFPPQPNNDLLPPPPPQPLNTFQ